MRTITENKQVRLNELSPEQVEIVTAERKLNGSKRRLEETQREIARAKEDAELFSRSLDPDHLRALERQEKQDAELVSLCESALSKAKAAPAEREKREKRGAELMRHASALDKRIEAALESVLPILREADEFADTIVREFGINKSGWTVLDRPFTGTSIVLRLRHWKSIFEGHLKAYRTLNEPAKAVEPSKAAAPLGTYRRSVPLSRKAVENARVRSRLTPTGVVTETSR
jgi:hypothetical protein